MHKKLVPAGEGARWRHHIKSCGNALALSQASLCNKINGVAVAVTVAEHPHRAGQAMQGTTLPRLHAQILCQFANWLRLTNSREFDEVGLHEGSFCHCASSYNAFYDGFGLALLQRGSCWHSFTP